MNIEPKIAIACRDKVEIKVALQLLEKAGILWFHGQKPTMADFIDDVEELRLYIYPRDDGCNYVHILYNEYIDDFEYDNDDGFEWTYVEASDMFRNQIIAERRKNAIRT